MIEIFNYNYWKIGYASLALDYGIHHYWLQNTKPTSWSRIILYFINQKRCMNSNLCRRIARTDDIHVTYNMINITLDVMLKT